MISLAIGEGAGPSNYVSDNICTMVPACFDTRSYFDNATTYTRVAVPLFASQVRFEYSIELKEILYLFIAGQGLLCQQGQALYPTRTRKW